MVEGAVVGVDKDPGFFAALRMTEEAAASCFLRSAGYAKISLAGRGEDNAGWLRGDLLAGRETEILVTAIRFEWRSASYLDAVSCAARVASKFLREDIQNGQAQGQSGSDHRRGERNRAGDCDQVCGGRCGGRDCGPQR